MNAMESTNLLKSFEVKNGLFEELSEVEMSDVIGGSCGGGGGGWGPPPNGFGSSGPCLPGWISLPDGSPL